MIYSTLSATKFGRRTFSRHRRGTVRVVGNTWSRHTSDRRRRRRASCAFACTKCINADAEKDKTSVKIKTLATSKRNVHTKHVRGRSTLYFLKITSSRLLASNLYQRFLICAQIVHFSAFVHEHARVFKRTSRARIDASHGVQTVELMEHSHTSGTKYEHMHSARKIKMKL